MANKMKVVISREKQIFIHNDLSNAAHYFTKTAEKRIADNDREGVGIEMMAGLVMLAFAAEAKFNFIGWRVFGDRWNERQPAYKKVDEVVAELKIEADFSTRPFKTLNELRDFRDTVAHGKPQVVREEQEVIIAAEELDDMGFLQAGWERWVKLDYLKQSKADLDEIWKVLLDASKLEIFDTLTQGSGGVTFIENVHE